MRFNQLKVNLRVIYKLIFYLIPSVLLSACVLKSDPDLNNLNNDKPVVITTFTVLADLAKNVAGDRLIIKSITKPGAEIHGYQFTPSDLVKAKNADLIIENGLGLELWINKFIASSGNIPKVTLSEGLKPLLIEEDAYAGKPNPHVWMSPVRTIHYVDKLANAFSKIDPLGKDHFIENANNYKKKLFKLDEQFRLSLSSIPIEKRLLVTCEGAFSYLAKDYGLKEAYLWPVNAESQVTPKRMANLISKIKESKVPAIFCETTVSSRAQLQVVKATGVAFGGNFFVDSLSDSDGPASTLLELQRYNLDLIRKGLAVETLSK